MADPYHFAAMALEQGDVDGMISGSTQNYADCLRPILEIIGTGPRKLASGLNLIIVDKKMYSGKETGDCCYPDVAYHD